MSTRRLAMVLGIAFLLSACRETPHPIAIGPDPTDGSLPARERGYRSVTSDARTYAIVTPQPWGKSNEEVAPKSK
jgi:hypothetical protein